MTNEGNMCKASSDPRVDTISDYIERSAVHLSAELNRHMKNSFKPGSQKQLRKFTLMEAAELLGTSSSNLRKLHEGGKISDVETDARGRRFYRAAEIQEVRDFLARSGRNVDTYKRGRRSAADPMQVITINNFKGGSGKSTSTIHLAQRFALRGYRVLAIDLDPQGSLTTMFGFRPEIEFAERGTIYDVLTYDNPVPMRNVIRKTYFQNLDLAPAGIMLSEYETETAVVLGRNGLGGHDPFFNRMSKALATVDADYDVVFIDCPPQIGFLTLSALSAATGVLITVIPSMLDIASMAQFLMLSANLVRTIEEHDVTPNWAFMKYLITRYEPNEGPANQMAGFLRMMFPDDVMVKPMLKSAAINDAAMTQETIYEVDPSKFVKKTLERALDSVNGVAAELEQHVQAAWGRGDLVREPDIARIA